MWHCPEDAILAMLRVLNDGSFRGTELTRQGRSFCARVAPTPFALFVTFRLLEGCSFWVIPTVFLTNSTCRWTATVGVASRYGVGSTASA